MSFVSFLADSCCISLSPWLSMLKKYQCFHGLSDLKQLCLLPSDSAQTLPPVQLLVLMDCRELFPEGPQYCNEISEIVRT